MRIWQISLKTCKCVTNRPLNWLSDLISFFLSFINFPVSRFLSTKKKWAVFPPHENSFDFKTLAMRVRSHLNVTNLFILLSFKLFHTNIYLSNGQLKSIHNVRKKKQFSSIQWIRNGLNKQSKNNNTHKK